MAGSLNRPSSINNAALDTVPQQLTQEELGLPPTLEEVKKAITQISAGKAPGKDGISAEIHKAAGRAALEAFHSVVAGILEDEDMPQELRDASIISLFKNKGTRADCANNRRISLLSIGGKSIPCFALNRLTASISEANLPESHCGFHPGRSTIDMVFAIRHVQENASNRTALWVIISKL